MAAALLGLVGLIVGGLALKTTRALRRDQRVLMADRSATEIVEQQATLQRTMTLLTQQLDQARVETAAVDAKTDRALRDMVRTRALVRYDAFGDQGGHQSWSLALLDATHSGVVITGLLGREETRMYVKQLRDGVPDRELSDEEAQAVAQAQSTKDQL